MAADPSLVEEIRVLSRTMVRKLGFMGGDFAGTDLSPSAVHALIEIEREPGVTARDLGLRLHLEKSSVSRMLGKLIGSGAAMVAPAEGDGRLKRLFLTQAGQKRVSAIHTFARGQVSTALGQLEPGQDRAVLEGLRLYAAALAPQTKEQAGIEIVSGYRTGLIARITHMHALYYARTSDFGLCFETVVASGLADFCRRLERPGNAIWVALRQGEIVGSVAIDGEDLGGGAAHLRWFMAADEVRGQGVGRRLLAAALAFVDEGGFARTHLWTFSGLLAARHLYEAHGFVCVEEQSGRQWGEEVLEQQFVRQRRALAPA